MLFTILIIVAVVALVAIVVMGVQKAKAEKKGIYADEAKCPYHDVKDEESVVGYETAAPAPAVVEKPKKKAAKKSPAKKTAPKKANSSQKKK
jgi:FtsZ-interacting cell division protein ZipA